MINMPNILLIGATDRNVGKTTFACGMIKQTATLSPVIALKITVIKEKNGMCPRGGKGCGVCSSVDGNYMITEELNTDTQKDTSKMLAAGAVKVLWLRVMEHFMEEGVKALLDCLGNSASLDSPIICESNSIRKVIDPGVFVVFNKKNDNYIKPSCSEVIKFADNIISFDPDTSNFNVAFDRFNFNDTGWTYKEKAAAIILAGGVGQRFGSDKSMLPVNGKSMIEHIAGQLEPNFFQLLVGAGGTEDIQKFSFLGCDIIPDEKKGYGPLMGILSCIEHSKRELNFVVGCDIPNIDMLFVRKMLRETEGYDAIVPISADGLIEPLFAIYRRSTVTTHIRNILYNSTERRIRALFDRIETKYIKMDTESDRYININTKDDYNEFMNS